LDILKTTLLVIIYVKKNNLDGIHIDKFGYNIINNNICHSNKRYGISIKESDNNIIKNNNCSSNMCGVFLHHSCNNNIYSNICSLNYKNGIQIGNFPLHFGFDSWPNNNTITKNVCMNNLQYGLYVDERCGDNIFFENIYKTNGIDDIYPPTINNDKINVLPWIVLAILIFIGVMTWSKVHHKIERKKK